MERTFVRMLHEARARSGARGAAGAWIGAARDAIARGLVERRAARPRLKGLLMDSVVADFRQAFRSLRGRPGLSIAAVLTIGIGIGANAGIFGIVNAVLLRPLPYHEPERIVMMWERFPPMQMETMPWSPHDFVDVRARAKHIESMALFAGPSLVLTGAGEPVTLDGVAASPSLFRVLGVSPLIGQPFAGDAEEPANRYQAILSYSTWRDRFALDPGVVGRVLTLNGRAVTVTGVMPESFHFPPPVTFGEEMLTSEADIYVPYPIDLASSQRGAHNSFAVGRLAPGATLASAGAELDAIATAIGREFPRTNSDVGMHVMPLHAQSVTTIRRALLVILSAVAAVLLIACASVANLLLARATARKREIALRTALGASRRRLVSLLLAESLLLGAAGGVLGLILAHWIALGVLTINPIDLPPMFDVRVDARVFTFTMAATLLSVLGFGLVPALQGSRTDVRSVLQSGARVSGSRSELRVKNALVVGQVAVAIVLLVAAALTIRSFERLWSVTPGFSAAGVVVTSLSLPQVRYPDAAAQAAFQARIVEGLSAIPGTRAAAVAASIPFTPDRNAGDYRVEGQPPRREGEYQIASRQRVSAGYFAALEIPLRDGRLFTDVDVAGSTPVAIVSKSFVDRHWPGASALGRGVTLDTSGETPTWMRIVGVVEDLRMRGFQEPIEPLIYQPAAQAPAGSMWLVMRSERPAGTLAPDLRTAVAAVDRDLPLNDIESMSTVMGETVRKPKFTATLLAAFGGAALLIAAVGLYGVMSFDVARQTRDIGVRIALGATPSQVRQRVVSRGVRLTLTGLALGLAGALAAGRLLEGLLFGITTTDLPAFTVAAGAMLAVALLASWLPARRATKVDPIVALRAE
jgi:putative ABC transport system permease protein